MKAFFEKHKDFIMEVIHFGMVGVINTLMGWGIMAVLYNAAHINYWLSSGISYFIGSVFSYHANSKVTFKVENKDKGLPWRFAINIIICYLIAFSLAKPLVEKILSLQAVAAVVERIAYALAVENIVIIDNVAMIFGMGFFIILNFFGQKLFVFRKTGKGEKK